MNYLTTLTSPAPAHYGAERQAIPPDSKSFFSVVRLPLPDGSSTYARALDPERKNKVEVRVLTHLQKDGKPTAESREITVTRAYWDANAKSTFLDGLGERILWSAAAFTGLSIATGAAIGYLSPSYGTARGAGVGASFVAGSFAASALRGKSKSAILNNVLFPFAVGGMVAAGTAALVKRR